MKNSPTRQAIRSRLPGLVTVISMLLLGAIATWILTLGDRPSAAERPLRESDRSPSLAQTSHTDEVARTIGETEEDPSDSSRSLALVGTLVQGRVVAQAGGPAAGADVELRLGYSDELDDPPSLTTLTDAAGRFEIQCATPDWISAHVVRMSGHAVFSSHEPWMDDERPSRIDLGDIHLRAEARVEGRVRSEDGRTITCARVEIHADGEEHGAPVQPDGSFHIGQVGPEVQAALLILCESNCHADIFTTLAIPPASQVSTREFVLLRERAVTGVVSNVGGKPIEGARVLVDFRNDEPDGDSFRVISRDRDYGRTDELGHFRITTTRPFRRAIVRAEAVGFHDGVQEVTHDPSAVDEVVVTRITLSPAPTVIVEVTDAVSAAPIRGARVTMAKALQGQSIVVPSEGRSIGSETEPGRYLFTSGGPGLFLASVKHPNYGARLSEPFAPHAMGTTRIQVRLDPVFDSTFQVIANDTGEPVAGARLWAAGPTHGQQRNANLWTGVPNSFRTSASAIECGCVLWREVEWTLFRVADREGKVTVPCHSSGQLQLRVESNDYGEVFSEPVTVAAGGGPIVIRVPRKGSIQGQIIGYDGSPLAARNVLIHRNDGVLRTLKSQPDGTFDSGPLPNADYELFVGGDNRARSDSSGRWSFWDDDDKAPPDASVRVQSAAAQITIDQRALPTGAITGVATVRGADLPITVYLNHVDAPTRWGHPITVGSGQTLRRGYLYRTAAANDGAFLLERIPPGRYHMSLSAGQNDPPLATREVEVRAGLMTHATLTGESASLTVEVFEASGDPALHAKVQAIHEDGDFLRPDDRGSGAYRFRSIRPGRYWIKTHAKGFSRDNTSAELTSGTNEVIVKLPPAATIELSLDAPVTMRSNRPAVATLHLGDDQPVEYFESTAKDNTLRLIEAPPGDWTVVARVKTTSGTYEGSGPVRVVGGETSRLAIRLQLNEEN